MIAALLLALVAAAWAGEPGTEPPASPRVAVLTPAQLLDGLADVLPPRPEANATRLLPVGFSRAGAFAFITEAWYSEMDGLAWSFVIQDLRTDAVLVRLPKAGSPPVQTLAEGLEAHRVALEAALTTHGIDARPRLHPVPPDADPTRRRWDPKSDPELPSGTPLLRPFPLFVNQTACAVTAAPAEDGQFQLTMRCGSRAKPLGTVWNDVAAPVAIGALISPYEQRVAVVVQTASTALHGSDPMNLAPSVFGAHLTGGF